MVHASIRTCGSSIGVIIGGIAGVLVVVLVVVILAPVVNDTSAGCPQLDLNAALLRCALVSAACSAQCYLLCLMICGTRRCRLPPDSGVPVSGSGSLVCCPLLVVVSAARALSRARQEKRRIACEENGAGCPPSEANNEVLGVKKCHLRGHYPP
ncbi:hypothetical protein NDU88_000688 [Pleurodeles waltl]|uniref:Uncharacterized protein n=1 Tax=Pleurodeles waltl TaxID=8319 RepID=A0AAV7KQL9_PLEWA|nr:hypothetical protein NDU88_000688 [Pleurodeles waltl]